MAVSVGCACLAKQYNGKPMSVITLKPEPLTAANFAPFGDVIEVKDGNRTMAINYGLTERHHDLADIQILKSDEGDEGEAIISIFESKYREYPLQLEIMERHPLGSQCFIPMHDKPYVIVVADPTLATVAASDLRAFISNGKQGINYRANTWHHYLLAPFEKSLFAVVDRGGKGHNLEEQAIREGPVVLDL
jgi:ureidoglycolate lyase